MRDLERDLLLASSGELRWWRRASLARRLRRDPAARRLAETLAVTRLVLDPAPAASRRRLSTGWLATGIVAATVLGLAFVLWAAFNARAGSPTRTGTPAVVTTPLHESTSRLLVAGYALTPQARLVGADSLDAPLLPPWSEGFDDEQVWDLIDERSQ